MATAILNEHKRAVGSLELVPSSGGIFEIEANGRLIFSKRQLHRFPEAGEAEGLVRAAVRGEAVSVPQR